MQNQLKTPNAQKVYEVSTDDLPLHCPTADMSLWNSHPRVYLPIDQAPNKRVICPYCGAEYRLVEQVAA